MTAKLTPMQEQYQRLKQQHPEALLFFRLGDFYELFGEDAEIAAPILDVQLTTRDKVTPMCGVPYHAVDQYLRKLVEKGFTIAIAEQMEDPRFAKGLVEREIIRVVSPGTFVDESDGKPTRFAVLYVTKRDWALVIAELATGSVYFTEQRVNSRMATWIQEEWERWHPQEYLTNWETDILLAGKAVPDGSWFNKILSPRDLEQFLAKRFNTSGLRTFGLVEHPTAQAALFVLWRYLTDLEHREPVHLTNILWFHPGQQMAVSARTLNQLHVLSSDGPSLLSILDKTLTPMGSRLLAAWLERPLTCKSQILLRQQAIKWFMTRLAVRKQVRERLQILGDLSKKVSRVALGMATPKDLVAIAKTLAASLDIYQMVQDMPQDLLPVLPPMDVISDILLRLRVLKEDVPNKWDEGNIIQEGVDAQIDRLRSIITNQREALASLEQDEKDRSGIKTLKVGYHRTFGYYLEVSRGQTHKVPEDWRRRQTMANAERYTSDALLDLERTILEALDRVKTLEYERGRELLLLVQTHSEPLNQLARWLATLDVYSAVAEVAVMRSYTFPEWQDGSTRDMEITGLRHPILETLTPHFVPSSVTLPEDLRVMLITGPNMGGKSTFMRALALNVIMAHIGAPVACEYLRLPVFSGVYARIGADDDIYRGQSTFMVEMEEMAWILRQSDRESLVILDELGRGTSTFDGMAIAQAVVERLATPSAPLTLFATHYHELTQLAASHPRMVNFTVEVIHDPKTGQLVFTHRIISGAASRSYGVEVAELAGFPKTLLTRARHLLTMWEEQTQELTQPVQQVTWFRPDPLGQELLDALRLLELDDLSPRDAWLWLQDWRERVKRANLDERSSG
ncbi:DNA mismatch repair protein MutS [Sulfobacillus thermosulfidooxidans]|uniref:DNA mismatch repair protein MutS n=1 Tax=Sulfobacillus thermosulfidooxidans TaxID=28034 RepID=UPI00096B7C63|nr:DNA mismatch repair protein MutS [Sulfobacillus thermosulfidooxidans]OLZ09547.1 DNA mismatch repair protein MutS [Sulfobacillus thermosulfidooxidans]OLZ16147.1 DNA mismatch repair protein MutS [Sulfobacillus thermosulfidooxidans]OLZ18005.1 DNA mismatch repair protein MutS [Sulfobacillus thermosulfidooxidans]